MQPIYQGMIHMQYTSIQYKHTTNTPTNTLLIPLILQPNRLAIHEDTLALVRLGFPPHANLGRKLHHDLLLGALEQQAGGLGRAGRHALWQTQFDGVRVSDLQVHVLLAGVLWLDGRGFRLDRRSVSDSDETEDGRVAFADAEDVVLEVGARGAWTRSLECLLSCDAEGNRSSTYPTWLSALRLWSPAPRLWAPRGAGSRRC